MLVVLMVLGAFVVDGQEVEWAKVYSEKFHFIADFPAKPKQDSGEIETRFGKFPTKRWTVEVPGILYEVSVAEFSASPVKGVKDLNRFYQDVCNDLFVKCDSGAGNDQFDVLGREWGFRSKKDQYAALAYLARNRFYLIKVIVDNKIEKEKDISKSIRKFIEGFLFVQVNDSEKKWTWGLPPSATQVFETNQ